MMKIKVMSIFGTRPEAIKMAPLVKSLENDERFESIVCVTAQHREMLDSVLKIFDIKPQYDLNIMAHGQTIIEISNKVLKGVDEVIKKVDPNIVLVHGDTSTTLNGALAAFYNKVPVGHVEAGLRSYDIYSPFPEEMNRKLTGGITNLHFAPTQTNESNLLSEGVDRQKIYVTGNTVIDALLSVVNENHKFEDETLNNIDFMNKKVVLLTTHRRENWGEPMENIFKAMIELVENNEDVEVVFPMHKNPSIRELAHKYFDRYIDKVHLIEPLEYVEFTNLMSKVYLIMTDSGGIQEEAPALGKPVMVLRTETERPEAVEAGTVRLAGIEKEAIVDIANELISNKEAYKIMSQATNPYGDGKACERILNIIEEKIMYMREGK
ncbi:non-hydrolyzing UDP-N-acetylglucosamine 2-epimerase [Paraclostridium sordellii]|uniref:non-hydrolyzing UDP-N-acetylglucosamine 2-epimerase n=1 Tax=Paraclostridium sordellii TaxID=1505 RepID=UPI0012D83A83|nr:UDP-N-acetylglucosamine 2-epimerase (non-hydrolyzing) [Paeniclostridium sordellii]MDU6483417.1 UDP-N-acetylglucosamine 2-epimerase (non-hydrolyzing) [Paeniclostridium sordellii]MRZ80953.1 UDP-N-acetylglucosamine 2-epimerase (non-hydrolyzing) [Paeniclostridium sordellii]MSB58383.1 UDP-N-acetylglucosamine 2-epimerase (non-hydrolyzing) [Paeniclostridium sordellii]MVO72193.1 UDP-N-acetylglucosamine 2-epimerase (non-hydrolyzing) [Paeniclostridium sordellii]